MKFKDRADGGKQLAEMLLPLAEKDPLILGLPRGGVPVAFEIARALNKPLDVLIVRKLGVPWQPELAFGAIGEFDEVYLNQEVINELGISEKVQDEIISQERNEIKKRQFKFRANRTPIDFFGRSVIIVDDGIATGATVAVACRIAQHQGAKEVFVAAPVSSKEAIKILKSLATKCIILRIPENFYAVGEWYQDFSQTSDEDVVQILRETVSSHGS